MGSVIVLMFEDEILGIYTDMELLKSACEWHCNCECEAGLSDEQIEDFMDGKFTCDGLYCASFDLNKEI